MCEGTGRSWEVSRGQGYTAAAWGPGAGWGTTLDVIDPSRWTDAQGSQRSSSKLNCLCQDCWNQFVPQMQKPGSLSKVGKTRN